MCLTVRENHSVLAREITTKMEAILFFIHCHADTTSVELWHSPLILLVSQSCLLQRAKPVFSISFVFGCQNVKHFFVGSKINISIGE